MKSVCILNQNAPLQIFRELERYGFLPLPLPPHPDLMPREAAHADMQFCKISRNFLVCAPNTDAAFIEMLKEQGIFVQEGETRLNPDYPGNIAYNILTAEKLFFHNLPFSDPLTTALLQRRGLSGVKIKQGYAACSAAAITASDGASCLLTGDRGILLAAERQHLGTVFLSDREIVLAGFPHGFAGGCCGVFQNTLYTCGTLPDGVLRTLEQREIPVVSLYDGPLTDIGGLLFCG